MFPTSSYFSPEAIARAEWEFALAQYRSKNSGQKQSASESSEISPALLDNWIDSLESISLDIQNDQPRSMILDDLIELRHQIVQVRDDMHKGRSA